MVMNDQHVDKFTCSSCGGHTLTVTHVWSLLAGEKSERWREWGPLKENHNQQYEFKEKIGDTSDDEVQKGDFGEFQEDDSASEPEEYEIHASETNPESGEFFVNCENCDREIAFGWSQPDRQGLILPVEFSDFNPSESWPDPRYADAWRINGWVHQ
jgi:hypothetical protein